MRNIFLSAGHTNVKGLDRGASANGYIEGELTAELRDLISDELETLGLCAKLDKNANALTNTIQYFRNLISEKCIALDIHWNAASSTATGTEVFIPNNPSNLEIELAHKLAKTVSETLEIPLRGSYEGKLGVKTESQSARKSLGWMRLNGHNVLLEVCFITNKNEMLKYQEKKSILALKLAKVLYEYANK